jgi:acetoin utilization deacetylase AcuC-like enzyme
MIKIANHPLYAHPLPTDHRFPMLKYELIPEQLLYEGVINENQFITPNACAKDVVLLTHTIDYYNKLINLQLSAKEQRAIGFPQSAQLINRELHIMQGTINCALYALQNNTMALNIAGGTHHAFADRGEGFCLLNDMAIATNYLLHYKLAAKVLIIDLDVHQGNGTASIFKNRKDVFTFSMHGATNYPFHKEESHLDIGLDNDTNTNTYLSLLHNNLPNVLDSFKPDFVFYLCGVDILDTDKFGKLKVSMQGCKQRDEYVLQLIKQRNLPCAAAMGGGYSADIKLIVEAHCNTFKLAAEIFE